VTYAWEYAYAVSIRELERIKKCHVSFINVVVIQFDVNMGRSKAS